MKKEVKVSLVAAFQSLKFLPKPLAIGANNVNPKLLLLEDGIEYRNLFFTNRKRYDQIEMIDIHLGSFEMLSVKTTNIYISFNDSIFTFMGNLNSLDKLKNLLIEFRDRGCPLSEEALNLIDGG